MVHTSILLWLNLILSYSWTIKGTVLRTNSRSIFGTIMPLWAYQYFPEVDFFLDNFGDNFMVNFWDNYATWGIPVFSWGWILFLDNFGDNFKVNFWDNYATWGIPVFSWGWTWFYLIFGKFRGQFQGQFWGQFHGQFWGQFLGQFLGQFYATWGTPVVSWGWIFFWTIFGTISRSFFETISWSIFGTILCHLGHTSVFLRLNLILFDFWSIFCFLSFLQSFQSLTTVFNKFLKL